MATFFSALALLGSLAVLFALTAAYLYGVYLCFKKSWHLGFVGFFLADFAFAVGAYKLFAKKDILA